MLPLWAVVLVLLLALAVLVFHGAAVVFAYQMPRLEPEAAPSRSAPRPRVSVVIAARNEEVDLPVTLDALLAQKGVELEIVVVDGGSADGTRAVVEARAPHVRWIEEPPLPAGWVGKNWGCATGAAATHGEWILFLDADVRTHPATIRTTLDWAEREGAALATLGSRIEMVGRWERTILPFYVQMVLTYFRTPRVNRAGSRAAMANGQFLLVRRADYDSVGGHAAVRAFVLEDIAIAQRFRAAGKTLRVAWAPDLAMTRMYRSRAEMSEGILKNIHGTHFSTTRQVGFLAALIGLFWLPLAVLPLGLLTGSLAVTVAGAVLWLAIFAKHVGFARTLGAGAAYGLLYPVAVGFYVVLVARSIARARRAEPVAWKGRSYPLLR